MMSFFESRLSISPEDVENEVPKGLLRFYWMYVRRAKLLFGALLVSSLMAAVADVAIPIAIGMSVGLLADREWSRSLDPSQWHQLYWIAALLLVARPVAIVSQQLITQQGLAANFANMVRWHSHAQVMRNKPSYFVTASAGVITERVMQIGPALRESVTTMVNALWYLCTYAAVAGSALVLIDGQMGIPLFFWFVSYVGLLTYIIPRLLRQSNEVATARSDLAGTLSDLYANNVTVRIFCTAETEVQAVREAFLRHTHVLRQQMRTVSTLTITLSLLNALLVTSTAVCGVWMWTSGKVGVGAVTAAMGIVAQATSVAAWIAHSATVVFENAATVQDAAASVAHTDREKNVPDARALDRVAGGIEFENVTFGYPGGPPILRNLSMTIRPGERVAIVGQSGAGKSTLFNLLLRLQSPVDGRILIDGKDIAQATVESVRARISAVLQDTSLLNRTIADNIKLGDPEAGVEKVRRAADLARVGEFLGALSDADGRVGLDAMAGQRGAKVSGGERQRIAIARMIMKEAPIILLDEATSALDSALEASIMSALRLVGTERTMLVIAHRLSTVTDMDRILVLHDGRVVEEGGHRQLLSSGGLYQQMWAAQSDEGEAKYDTRVRGAS